MRVLSAVILVLLSLLLPAVARATVTASFAASRTTGVAPLGVFFDASASTCNGCSAVSSPWHDLSYQWEFDDPTSGDWAVSGRSKDTDVGPSAAHVFEKPGHYVVTLKVFDTVSGMSDTTTQSLDVTDPDTVFSGGNTYCYRAQSSGDFSGCPTGAQQKTQSDFIAAFNQCKASTHRCLFRRGDTFTAAGTAVLDGSAPGVIAAFGSGAKPLIDATHLVGTFNPPDGGTLFHGQSGGHDYRIVDLELKGPSLYLGLIFGANAVQSDVLLLRLEGTPGTWHAMLITEETQLTPKFSGWYKNMFLVEDKISHIGFSYVDPNDSSKNKHPGNNGANVAYLSWQDSAILGNEFEDTINGEHVIRAEEYDNLLVAHNRLGGAHTGKQVIALRSTDANMMPCSPVCAPSHKAHVHANTLYAVEGWTIDACGQVGNEKNRCADTIVDGNMVYLNPDFPVPGPQDVLFNLSDNTSYDVTFRNNICNLTGAAHNCAQIDPGSLARVFNNSCYGSGGSFTCVKTAPGSTTGGDSFAQNNLAFAVGGTATAVSSGFHTADHNLVATSNPFVAAMPGVAPEDYRLATDSSAIDAGAAVVNLFDFGGISRPQGAAFDIGAWEYAASSGNGGGGGGGGEATGTTSTSHGSTSGSSSGSSAAGGQGGRGSGGGGSDGASSDGAGCGCRFAGPDGPLPRIALLLVLGFVARRRLRAAT